MDDFLKLVEGLSKTLPKFPDGRIDYTNSAEAAALNIFVEASGEFLLLKRSEKVGNYGGKWASVAGYMDEVRPIEEKVLEELREEIGVEKELIKNIAIGNVFFKKDLKLEKIWIICPIVVKLKSKPEINLDWEHTEFKWVRKEEILSFDLMPGVELALENLPIEGV